MLKSIQHFASLGLIHEWIYHARLWSRYFKTFLLKYGKIGNEVSDLHDTAQLSEWIAAVSRDRERLPC